MRAVRGRHADGGLRANVPDVRRVLQGDGSYGDAVGGPRDAARTVVAHTAPGSPSIHPLIKDYSGRTERRDPRYRKSMWGKRRSSMRAIMASANDPPLRARSLSTRGLRGRT